MATKKKAKAKNKKGAKGKADDEPVDDGDANKADMFKKEEDFDLFVPASFERALAAKIQRPFIFGPVEFDNLNLSDEQLPFDPEEQRDKITSCLERSI